MDDSIHPSAVPDRTPPCLSEKELNTFIDLIEVEVDRLNDVLVVIHAEAGPVSWLWDETLMAFCVANIH